MHKVLQGKSLSMSSRGVVSAVSQNINSKSNNSKDDVNEQIITHISLNKIKGPFSKDWINDKEDIQLNHNNNNNMFESPNKIPQEDLIIDISSSKILIPYSRTEDEGIRAALIESSAIFSNILTSIL